MGTPTVLATDPTDGATGVFRNQTLLVTFTEDILASSVKENTVYLRSVELGSRISAEVGVDEGTPTRVIIVPASLLIPDSSYVLVLVGVDIEATDNIKSAADSTPLPGTVEIAFQTGSALTVPAADTGDLTFPEEVQVVASQGTPLRIVKVTPKHHAFGIPTTTSQIEVKFNKLIDPDSVPGNLSVSQYAYYEEEGFRAVETDLGQGDGLRHYFQCETSYYTGGDRGFLDPLLFEDAGGYADATGQFVRWNFTGDLQKNVCVEMIIGSDIADTDGITLGSDQVMFACTEPWPSWASLTAIRHEIGHEVAAGVPDDFIGLRIWQTSIDLAGEMGWTINFAEPGRYYRQVIRCSTGLEIWADLKSTAALNSGVSKKLGDLSITYAATTAAVRPWKVQKLEEDCQRLKRAVYGAKTQTPRIGIKSAQDPLEPSRGFFRQRLWRAELMDNDVLTPATAANTAAQRLQADGYGTGRQYWLVPGSYLE